MSIEGLEGRWAVWSQSGNSPGAYFFVPADDVSREAGIKFVEVRVIYPATAATPKTQVLNTEYVTPRRPA